MKKTKTKKSTAKTKRTCPLILKFKKPSFQKVVSNKLFKVFLTILGALFMFILVDFFFQYLNNGYSIAVIDGARISKKAYHKRLEAQYGQSTTKQLIDEKIILLEAEKNSVSASEEEVQARLDDIITSVGGQESYQAALLANGITEKDLKTQIELDILATKILEPTLEYDDDDIKKFFDQYSNVIFPTETAQLEEGEKLDYEQYREKTKEVFIQQEVENSKYSWLEGLFQEYKIQDNSTSTPKYGVLTATVNIFRNLFDEANKNELEE
ncbi:hypothetical protein GX888_01785 [Candidatus Dojkabacteria bacterium]|uniref:peptidylprolyl isomerase n=1 Tax=Candidatus Dojkabacteria bacterium TaxID=2099670 RepID=A0A847VDA3_9BACT|nr:hypothetical protein [Candidatus Dojkabacteria bacterium]